MLIAAPIAVMGSLLAHQVDYAIQAPSSVARAMLLASTGHGYLRHLPMILAACLATGFVGAVVEPLVRKRVGGGVTSWPMALVAPLAFAIQEHLERLIHDGAFPAHLVTQPTFLMGVALQIPFALLAWGVARTIMLATRRAVLALQGRPRAVGTRPRSLPFHPPFVDRRRRAPLATRLAGRAPPLVTS